jgi:hypothetical protein
MELLVDVSAELSWLSETSRIPDTELALVVADDSADICCWEVLAVIFDSLLFRFSPFPPDWPLMLSSSKSELKTLAVCGSSGLWAPFETGRKPRASGAAFCT